MKKIFYFVISLLMVSILSSGCASEVDTSETVSHWKDSVSNGLAYDIEYAFNEIGENPDNIQTVECITISETNLFHRREYMVTFNKDYMHKQHYKILTIEWYDGEPEQEKFPREYLSAIRFESGIENQWTQTGWGEMQSDSAGEYLPPADVN